MPTFRTAPSANLSSSIKRLLASGGPALSPLGEIQADQAAAETAQKMGLAEKARAEAEQIQRSGAMREDPAARTEFAAHSAGIDMPDASRLMGAIRGQLEQPGPGDVDDAMVVGREAQPYPMGKPNVAAGQERVFRSALAAAMANQLATGHTNADQLTQATGNVQGQNLTEAVQQAIAAGETDRASAMNQGAKPGTQIKVFDNVGSTGATFAPGSGKVNASPTADPNNALLAGTVSELAAKTDRERAAAEKSRKEKPEGEHGKPPPGYRWGAPDASGNPKLVPIEGGPAEGSFKNVTTLRKEFNDQPEVKSYRDVLPIVESARTAPDTRAGDIQMAYAVGKILDPNSVVREGELKLVGDAATVMQKIEGDLRTFVSGKGRLTPATRAQLVSMLDSAVNQREASYKATEQTYRTIAQKNGFAEDQVIINPPKRNQPNQPAGEVQARKKIGDVEFVKIGGKWFQP